MIVGVVAGIIAGLVGFLPFALSLRFSKRHPSDSIAQTALWGLGGFFVSLVVVVVALIVCSKVAHDLVLPFGIAEIIVLIVATSLFVVAKNGRNGRNGQKGEVE